MTHRRITAALAAVSMTLPLITIAAGIFPDVSDNYPFKGEIESLARANIINGNPNGNYYPDKSVNRAEFLKLLYTATNRKPAPVNVGCFSDVERGSWYEMYVCDAASKQNGFVQGYSDGKFRPGSPVSRTEALKMVFMLFGLETNDVSSQQQDLIKFVDISVSAWYSKYIIAAYSNGMLPLLGQSGSRFYPDKELSRGEAAAYIFNAMNVRTVSSSSSSLSSVASSSSSSSQSTAITKSVAFPFKSTDTFDGKKPISYLFNLTGDRTLVSVTTTVFGFYPSDVTCRLYLINKEGFAGEYFLGIQDTNVCMIKAALRPGSYQLQLQPAVANVPFTVDASVGASDGNDGFIDAKPMNKGQPYTYTLDPNDLYDWFSFTVTNTVTATVNVASILSLNCIIYTPLTVDQFGFTGPQCGTPYEFQPGTYTVGVGRNGSDDVLQKTTFTIQWK